VFTLLALLLLAGACLLFLMLLPAILEAAFSLLPYLIVISLFLYMCR
jgi:hypothetical protein